MSKALITCDCIGSQTIDAEALTKATGLDVSAPCTALCTHQADIAAAAISNGNAIICCAQETRRFEEMAEELGVNAPPTLDLRDRAGWTKDKASTMPKMAALIADAALPSPPAKTLDVISEGLCLILGPADVALAAAEALKDHLGVTVLLAPSDDLPDGSDYDVVKGKLARASGALGGFETRFDALQQRAPEGRGAPRLSDPKDGARSQCDIILDLTGNPPLFPAPEKREGYLRADPANPPGVAAAILAASHLTGTFEKPLYVKTDSLLCAHSRAEQSGCSRCLDLCPTGAISPNGDHVTVDPMICAGCGACSAACPSGAIALDVPTVDSTIRRAQTMASAYLSAGGKAPRLLVVDAHGSEMIRLAARYGEGLPADVVPMEVDALNGFGHAEILAARAAGFASVDLLLGPATDRAALEAQVAVCNAICDGISVIDEADPDALTATLYANACGQVANEPVAPIGTRRQITRAAAIALNPDAEAIALPEGAPYGAVLVNTESCTLCLACVSLCPSGALGDNEDMPQLRFQEDACLQCGLCASVCPEDAITYEPRLDLTPAALTQHVLNEEEPFPCVECGALFGSKSAIDRITEKLTGHSMFSDPTKLRMIQMCDNCRVNAQFHSNDNPFAGPERPRPRTTEDYFSKRRDH